MWLHIGDYLRDTASLSPEAHGCYLKLLMALWTGDGVLRYSPDVLAQTAGLSRRKWARMAKTLLPFFQTDGVVLTQKRLLIELRRAQAAWTAAQAGGRARARQTRLPFPESGVPTLTGASGAPPPSRRTTATDITPELRALLDRRPV